MIPGSLCRWLGGALGGILRRTFSAWVDPDGTSNGQNAVTQTGIGSATVPAGNRLTLTLPDRVAGAVTVTGRLTVTGTGTPGGSLNAELSTDGGATFPLEQNLVTLAAGGSNTGTTTFNGVNCAPGQCIIRLRTTADQGTGLANATATCFAFATVWNTDNYAATYDSK